MTLPDTIYDGHSAILGRTGSGKSFTARGIVETWLDANRRVCIIDPTDVWWGLRSNATGDGPGYPAVVFGGDHADVEIGIPSAERVAQIIGTRNTPAVIVTGDMSGNERHQFMAIFLNELFRVNRASLHLVVDEADDVAPQKPMPESTRMLGAMERIVRRGRVRGFQVMMITQRPAVLNKNCLTQADTLIAMRMPAPQDRKALDAWITGQADVDQAKEVLASLSGLKRGEGWVWAPQEAVLRRQTFPLIATFDSMKMPGHGEIVQEPSTLAPVEIGDLLGLLQVESETAGQPQSRRSAAKVQDMQEQLRAAEERGRQTGKLEGMNEYLALIRNAVEKGNALIAAAGERATALHDVAPGLAQPAPAIDPIPQPGPRAPMDAGIRNDLVPPLTFTSTKPARTERAPVVPVSTEGKVTVPQQRILNAIAWWNAIGITTPTRLQVAAIASYSASSGNYATLLSGLRGAGLIEYDSGSVMLTEQGAGEAQNPTKPPSTAELHQRIYERLSGPQIRVLTPILTAYPGPISRVAVAQKAGYSAGSGNFATLLSGLHSLQFVLYPSRGDVIAANCLFVDHKPRAIRA